MRRLSRKVIAPALPFAKAGGQGTMLTGRKPRMENVSVRVEDGSPSSPSTIPP